MNFEVTVHSLSSKQSKGLGDHDLPLISSFSLHHSCLTSTHFAVSFNIYSQYFPATFLFEHTIFYKMIHQSSFFTSQCAKMFDRMVSGCLLLVILFQIISLTSVRFVPIFQKLHYFFSLAFSSFFFFFVVACCISVVEDVNEKRKSN